MQAYLFKKIPDKNQCRPTWSTLGKSVNFITGNTFHDGAGGVLGNPTGNPATENSSLAATNESLVEAWKLLLGLTSNFDELFLAIVNWYPDMNTENQLRREQDASDADTDMLFAAGSALKATIRSSCDLAYDTVRRIRLVKMLRMRVCFLHVTWLCQYIY